MSQNCFRASHFSFFLFASSDLPSYVSLITFSQFTENARIIMFFLLIIGTWNSIINMRKCARLSTMRCSHVTRHSHTQWKKIITVKANHVQISLNIKLLKEWYQMRLALHLYYMCDLAHTYSHQGSLPHYLEFVL